MNVLDLKPQPEFKESFHPSREKFVTSKAGCYVLSTFAGVVLYVGLAKNLRRRMHEHLENSEKTAETPLGRAILFHWIESTDLNTVERTWLNVHLQYEGTLPILNKIYSPVSI